MPSDQNKPAGFKDLLVWQKGMTLAESIYSATSRFPDRERFGLVSQLRRATVSIPSNSAEGQARRSTAESVQFISHAEGSLAEVETQLLLSARLGFLPGEVSTGLPASADELRRMLNSLRRKLVTRH